MVMRYRPPIEGVCAVLCDLGVDARVMEQGPFTEEPGVRWVRWGVMGAPLTEEPPVRWVQIADGPIRWVESGLGTLKAKAELTTFLSATREGMGFGALCYVPDARIAPDSPRVRMVSDRVKSFPLFGRVKRVRWEDAGLATLGPAQRAKDFS